MNARVLFVALIMAPAVVSAQTRVDFQRDVRPILSDNCFLCHGPDASTRKANLRLDVREGAVAVRSNGTPVVPGKPDESLLYKRITDAVAARRMPPLSSHKTLNDEQKDTLKRWIEQGAQWKEHWAFVTPVRPSLPAVGDRKWVRNPIDRFVLAKIEASGLAPNAEADRSALIRRLSLDLTGLPPRPEDVSAFLADTSSDAYAKLVNKLLSSPHYGEHRARYWLDAARYGDTNGLHYDNYRGGIWPYRDWVVRAFNANLPFDRFAVEQLAGDLLPNPTLDQRIATGFVRNNATTNENGIIEEEVRFQYIKDRADTAGTVFLGLTVGCATCHDHKFDPISQKDHYALEAFFNNTTERIMDNNRPDPPPIVVVPADRDRARWLELEALRTSLRARMAKAEQSPNARFDRWLRSSERARLQDPLANAEILGSVPAAAFDGKSLMTLPSLALTGAEPFSMTAWVHLPKIPLHPGQTGLSHALVIASQMSAADPDAKPAAIPPIGWIFEIDEGVARLRMLDSSGKTIRAQAPYNKPVAAGAWNHLTFTYDGSRTEDGFAFYLNGTRLPTERGSYGAQDSSVAPRLNESIKTDAPLTIGAAANGEKGIDGSIAGFRIFDRIITEDEARVAAAWPAAAASATMNSAELTASEKNALKLYYLMYRDASYQSLAAQFARASVEHREIELRSNTAMVMEERTDAKPAAPLLFRGMYDQPREVLEAATPSFLPPMGPELPRNRLGLAQWIVDRRNPLFARVTVNRFWQELFGAGLVESADDFGAQAQPPSHPELLDWLAVEFRESGWDVKKLITLMVTSATYRQSAAISQEKLRRDPKNVLLTRGPRFRLDGEVVRDSALAASGLLVTKLGGPPVKPYQPAGIWEGTSMVSSNTRNYKQDSGEALYRRSLYTLWKRQAPPASMDIFDGPTREVCVVRRDRTNTPMQALVTMNDPQFVEAARVLAQNALRESSGDANRAIDFMTIRVLSRTFAPAERKIVLSAHEDFAAHYRANPDAASKLLAVGEWPADPSLPKAELAALTMVANQIFSLDEAVNK